MINFIYRRSIQLFVTPFIIFGLMMATLSPVLAASTPPPPLPTTSDLDSPGSYTLQPTITTQKTEPALKPAAALTKFVVNYNPTGTCVVTGTESSEAPVPNFIPPGANSAWPSGAPAAFEHALEIWELLLNINGTITINACWKNFGDPAIIASTQPVSVFSNFTNAPLADTLYPVALANEFAGSDLNGADVEITMAFNSDINPSDWYFGLDGNPGVGEIDFVTTAVHEIGHGLGFVSSLLVNTNPLDLCSTGDATDGKGCWGLGTNKPFIYDTFVYNGSDDQLIDTGKFPNPSVTLAQALTGTLVFSGTNAVAANSGTKPELYAPDPFSPGGSVLHLDETDTPPDHVFTPVAGGPAQHHPGPIALGILEDIGWNAVSLPAITFTKTASASSVNGGDTLTYTLTVKNTGYALATSVKITDTVPVSMTLDNGSLSGGGSAGGTSPGSLITWNTGISLTTNSGLSRTFVVTLDSDLDGTAINNTAYITTTAGIGANDSVSVNTISNIGGSGGVYLPIIMVASN